MRQFRRLFLWMPLLLIRVAPGQQMADPNFDAKVPNPAYVSAHPKIIVDEAHHNFHTVDGRYKPFAELLRSDGYLVVGGTTPFSSKSLDGTTVLVIANALGEGAKA